MRVLDRHDDTRQWPTRRLQPGTTGSVLFGSERGQDGRRLGHAVALIQVEARERNLSQREQRETTEARSIGAERSRLEALAKTLDQRETALAAGERNLAERRGRIDRFAAEVGV